MSDPAKKTNRGDGRSDDGKFASGNKISPGRKSAVRESQNLRRFREVVHLDRIGELAIELLAIALGPECKAPERLKAIQVLLSYSLPEARRRIDSELKISLGDSEEFRIAGASPAQTDKEMFEYIERLVAEREEYEKNLAAKYGQSAPNFATNGKAEATE